jgi:hypothetical protein
LSRKIVYQTLEDRNSDVYRLEADGPYPCHWENTWLGDGYYFWDTFIDNAHWWGRDIRKYKNGYIICEAICDFNDTECLGLHGKLEHLQMFKESYELMRSRGMVDNKTTVKKVLAFLQGEMTSFNYTAIRVNGMKSRKLNSEYSINLIFETEKIPYLDMLPAVQICFFKKNSLNLRNYKIVFPDTYREDEWV